MKPTKESTDVQIRLLKSMGYTLFHGSRGPFKYWAGFSNRGMFSIHSKVVCYSDNKYQAIADAAERALSGSNTAAETESD